MITAGDRYRQESSEYRTVVIAMFALGIATFALLHNVQAILPALSHYFALSPSEASLAVSVATGALALGVIPISVMSEKYGRVKIMNFAIILALGLGFVAPLCPSYLLLLIIRMVQGFALAGLPAVAVAYLSEEIDPRFLAGAVGTLIAGNSVGGLTGRLLAGVVTDFAGWRVGVAVVAVLALGCGIAFIMLLPSQRFFSRKELDGAQVKASLRKHLRDPVLVRAFGIGGLAMAAFITMYNYVGYRLLGPPFFLAPRFVILIFLAYLSGTVSSALAGRWAQTINPRVVIAVAALCGIGGAGLTLVDSLVVVLVGLLVHTIGFFAAHSVATSIVGGRATSARAQASSLYTLMFYGGASVGGWVGGLAYEYGSWIGVVMYMSILMFGMIVIVVTFPRSGSSRLAMST